MINQEQVDFLVSIAKECTSEDPIDWGELAITEDQAYQMMASQLLEQFSEIPEEQRLTISMSTCVKLLVENFVLNLRLKGADELIKGMKQ